MLVTCGYCLEQFDAKPKEVNRGNARFCSQGCSASYGNSLRSRVSSSSLHKIARMTWIESHDFLDPVCSCGNPADIHHKDGNPANNAIDNLEALCRRHHVKHENTIRPKRQKEKGLLGLLLYKG